MNLPFPLNILYFDPWVSGIFTGIIVALFTIRFTLKENDRWRINKCIEYLGNEINWNRNKFVLYKENIESLKPVSLDKNVLSGIYKWVDEISAVDKGPVYSVFKFDAFNYYQSSDIPTYVGIGFDYMLKEFYSASKRFCFNISFISNRIAEFYTSGNLDPISNEFDKMNIEFNNFQYAFGNFTSCLNDLNEIEYKGIKKVKFWVWHIFGLGNPKIVFSNVMAQESRNKKPI